MKYLILALFFVSTVFGMDGIYWEPCKYEKPQMQKHSGKPDSKGAKIHTHGGESAGMGMLSLKNSEDKNISASYLLPDLSVTTAELKDGMVTPKINMGGYYALTAFMEDANGSDFAIRYLSANGKPVKVSPVKLTNKQKNVLEIIPNPLPREHDKYTASKSYQFSVVYDGKPLENTDVEFKLGESVQKLKTTTNGKLVVALPNDFSGVTPESKQTKEFVLGVSKNENGKLFTSSFSAAYYPNANDWWQSQSLGFGGILLGFLGGLALYIRTRKDNK
jgi:hypothetical protein